MNKKYIFGIDTSKNDYSCIVSGYKDKKGFHVTKRHFCDINLLWVFKIKNLTVALYDRWLGFDYCKSDKIKNFGFFRFILD